MKTWKIILPAAVMLLLAGEAYAQTKADVAAEAEAEQAARAAEAREAEMDQRLREAEKRMEEAAREIAEITRQRLPEIREIERRYVLAGRPRLGVMIDSEVEAGPVEGVSIIAVTPGTAAADAGLRAGDILTAVNGESLSAESCEAANLRLLDFMKGVEEGDVVKVEYLRDGKSGSVEVEPRVVDDEAFVFVPDGHRKLRVPEVPDAPIAPEVLKNFKFEFGGPWAGSALGDLELVELNEGLGKYFGTDTGLLVVRAPKSGSTKLQDGDVIQSIDGREPKGVRHAMRILASYQAGEKLELGIMRNKKKITLEIEIPAEHVGNLSKGWDVEIRPAVAPAGPRAPAPVAVPSAPMAPAPTTAPVAPRPDTTT